MQICCTAVGPRKGVGARLWREHGGRDGDNDWEVHQRPQRNVHLYRTASLSA